MNAWKTVRKKTHLSVRLDEYHVGYFHFTPFSASKFQFSRRWSPTCFDRCCYIHSFISRCSSCFEKLLNIPECNWSLPSNMLWLSRKQIISNNFSFNMWHMFAVFWGSYTSRKEKIQTYLTKFSKDNSETFLSCVVPEIFLYLRCVLDSVVLYEWYQPRDRKPRTSLTMKSSLGSWTLVNCGGGSKNRKENLQSYLQCQRK